MGSAAERLERERERNRTRSRRVPTESRPLTVKLNRISKREREELRRNLPILDYQRPRTRAECPQERPCCYVACSKNLYLDVAPRPGTGNIRLNFPDREPEDMPPLWSCALDVADRGGATLEEVGEAMNIVRERVRQIEGEALRKIAKRGGPALRALVGALAEFSRRQTIGEQIEEHA
jgi:hypothetical protein